MSILNYDNKSEKFLVTGYTGFIGFHTYKNLLKNNYLFYKNKNITNNFFRKNLDLLFHFLFFLFMEYYDDYIFYCLKINIR